MLAMLEGILGQIAFLAGQFGIFVILNILDGHSTWKVIQPNHFHRERNPVARWFFRKLGLPRGIVIFKAVLLFILGGAFAIYAKKETKVMNITLGVANLVFLAVVIHNYKVYKRVKAHREIRRELLS
ncbi:MAG: DUF5658 family protein [Candidatus Cloacimonetes bacterium]|nr:DUF5658 family protein [Candidatus Cloacimonadota bacterium]MDD3143311.1 DUF5658 family protein [Candidatus Cloacimonadota bacterium]MDY0367310.1 DUF5658 family protein [Candidatus Syntrophosphaera sp.]HOY84590.1 DUF5658 family protein [Candidatus Syntrophosphaera sp.]